MCYTDFHIQRHINRGTNHWVRVGQKIAQAVEKALIFHKLSVDVMQFGHTDGCCLAHVGVFILQTLAQRFTQVFSDLVHSDAAHRPHGQRSDQRITVLTVLNATI